MTIRLLQTWNGYPVGAIITVDAATETALVNSFFASFTLTGGNTYAPNASYAGAIGFPRITFGARPDVAIAIGKSFCFTDVGGGTLGSAGGSVLTSTGTKWKTLNGACLLDAVDTTNNAIANTAEQQLNPNHALIPAGLINDFDRIKIILSASKNGTADTATIRLRFGPLGTVADPILATITALATTNQSLGTIMQFKRLSSTTIQKQGAGDPNVNFTGASATAYPAAVTVSNMDTTAMYLSVTSQMTTGAEIASLQDMTVELISTDS